MLKRFKNLKPSVLLSHILVTLAYPVVKAVTSEQLKLNVFCDVLTIVACILLIAGVLYSLVLHGDFDISRYTFRRGLRNAPKESYETYREKTQEKREDSFNYPLFVGLIYLAVSAFIAYALL